MKDPLDIHIQYKDLGNNAWVVALEGPLDSSTADTFSNRIQELFEKNPKHLLFDMENVNYVSSMGLGAIIGLYKKMRSGEIKFGFYDPQLSVRRVFEISKLDFLIFNHEIIDHSSPFLDYIKNAEPDREKKRSKKN